MHTITCLPVAAHIETYRCGNVETKGRTDPLRSLLRRMVAAGMSGPARVIDTSGRHHLNISSIEGAARFTLTEKDRDGLRLSPFTGTAAQRFRPASSAEWAS